MPRRHRLRRERLVPQRATGVGRQEPARIGDPGRHGLQQRGNDEEQADHGSDPAGGVADHRADGEGADTQHDQRQRRATDDARDVGITEPDGVAAAGPPDELAQGEGNDCGHHAQRQQDRDEDGKLAREHRQSARYRDHRRADHAGAVLAGDHQHGQHTDGQGAQQAADLAAPGDLGRDGRGMRVVGSQGRDQHTQPDGEHGGRGEGPPCRAQRPELGPLRADHAELGHRPGDRGTRCDGAGDGAGHERPPAVA